jgi:DsbC/DsbD-like thiol-disulfide interchange protein
MTQRILGRLMGVAVLATALVLVFGRDSRAGGKSDDEVKIAVAASKLDDAGKQVVTLTLTINKGWHIYANPVGNEDLAAAATQVKLVSKNKPQEFKINYPAGKENADKTLGKYRVYQEKVEIPINVHRAQGDKGPLELSIRFMACSKDGVCKLPATVKVNVP